MKVYWLEQTEADLPRAGIGLPSVDGPGRDGLAAGHELEWLSPRERAQLGALRFAKRRADWLLGRWTAKHAVAACLQLPANIHNLAKIEVRPRPSGAPEIFLVNKWTPITISLSHRAGRAICAVAPQRGALGCDLEVIEAHSEAFISDYLAEEEQALVANVEPADRHWLVTLLWSAKESALKALGAGLRLDTRTVIVTPVLALWNQNHGASSPDAHAKLPDGVFRLPNAVRGWRPLRVRHLNDQNFLGWWQQTGDLVRTLVALPPPGPPHLLEICPNFTSVAVSNQSRAA